MGEKTKDVIEGGANVALALAGAAGALAAGIPNLIVVAWTAHQERRIQKWARLVIDRSKSPDEIAARITGGLASGDERVVAGVVGGARAASSAIEPAAVVVIAELTRRFLQDGDLPRWFFRGALEVLERLEAGELGALRWLLKEIEPIQSERITMIGDVVFRSPNPDDDEKPWRAVETGGRSPSVRLTPFPDPYRLFGYIRRAGLEVETGASPAVLIVERMTVTWLREVVCADVDDT